MLSRRGGEWVRIPICRYNKYLYLLIAVLIRYKDILGKFHIIAYSFPCNLSLTMLSIFYIFYSLTFIMCRDGGMADARDLKSLDPSGRAGSSPAPGTIIKDILKTIRI